MGSVCLNVPLRIPGMYNAFILSFSRFIKLLTSTIQLHYFDCVRFCVVSSLLFNSFFLFFLERKIRSILKGILVSTTALCIH